MEQLYRIRTPQNVDFAFRIAGLPSRAIAWLLDLLCMVLLLLLLALVASPFIALGEIVPVGGFALAVVVLASFGILFGYCLLFEMWWNGQTPGKRVLGLRVIRMDGTPLDLRSSLIRNLLRLVDGFPHLGLVQTMLLGGLVALPGERCRRLGDWAAGTLVVQVQRTRVPRGFQATRGAYNSFRENGNLVTRLRRAVSPAERELIIDLCVRRDEVELEHRIKLFEEVSGYLSEHLGVQREGHMSHEKVVQNVADLLLDADLPLARLHPQVAGPPEETA